MDFLVALRQALAELHQNIEQTALARRMFQGGITRQEYLPLLSQMGHIHQELEQALESSGLPSALLNCAHLDRCVMIGRDLAVWGEDVPAPLAATAMLLRDIQQWSHYSPWSLVGCLYVLEGSRMGATYLVRPLAAGLGIEAQLGSGLDYYLDGLSEQPTTWKAFKTSLAELSLEAPQQAAIIQAAVVTMQWLLELYQDLAPTVELSQTVYLAGASQTAIS